MLLFYCTKLNQNDENSFPWIVKFQSSAEMKFEIAIQEFTLMKIFLCWISFLQRSMSCECCSWKVHSTSLWAGCQGAPLARRLYHMFQSQCRTEKVRFLRILHSFSCSFGTQKLKAATGDHKKISVKTPYPTENFPWFQNLIESNRIKQDWSWWVSSQALMV